MMRLLIICAIFCATLAAADEPSPKHAVPVVISHVNVVSMDAEHVLHDKTVVIGKGKILRITSKEISVPPNAVTIDGRGKFLMPALADLHVHLFSPDDLPAYVLNGVTTVLNMDGGPLQLKWRKEVKEGKLRGPTIYTAGHTIDGWPPLNEMFLTAETPTDARAMVRQQKLAGYDVIKVYGTLRPEVFRAILETARTQKISVVGHINRQLGAVEVLKSSQVLAAHLEDLVFARFDHVPTDPELNGFANEIQRSHITVTPNLNVNPTNIAQLRDLDGVLRSPQTALLPPAAYSQWMPSNNRNERNDQTAQQIQNMETSQQILYKLVKLLCDRGVPMVLGTDAAPYGVPGISVHQELQELVEAGVSPYDALLTATRNAGEFIATNIPSAARFGTVTEGSAADLLLLAANPLDNVRNTELLEGVVLHGRWLSSQELDSWKRSSERRFRKVKAELNTIDATISSGETTLARRWALSKECPSYAEWVLMTKARKLQQADLPAAIRVATLTVDLYPQSFSAWYVLGDLLFQHHELQAAARKVKRSLALEPHNSASRNLIFKIRAVQKPPSFVPIGTYKIEYTNDQSREVAKTELRVERAHDGSLQGTKIDSGESPKIEPIALRSVLAGSEYLWTVADTDFGPLEFRITVRGKALSGYWASPYGRNGHLRGTKND